MVSTTVRNVIVLAGVVGCVLIFALFGLQRNLIDASSIEALLDLLDYVEANSTVIPTVTPTVTASNPRLHTSRKIELKGCTMIHNEARFVVEWVAFHRLQGFQKIVIYDDQSTDNLAEVLSQFTQAGVVELVHLANTSVEKMVAPYKHMEYAASLTEKYRGCKVCIDKHDEGKKLNQGECQRAVFADCFARAHVDSVNWTIVFDVDEFIFRPLNKKQSSGTLLEYLSTLPKDVSQYYMTPLPIGTSGHVFANWTGLLTETHTQCPDWANGDFHTNRFHFPHEILECGNTCTSSVPGVEEGGKTFARPETIDIKETWIHYQPSIKGRRMQVRGDVPTNPVRMFHYQPTSLEDASERAFLNSNHRYTLASHPAILKFYSTRTELGAAEFAERVKECMDRTQENMFDERCIRF